MNGQSHDKMTTEDLKAITQAPTIEEPLVNEGEFPVELARSSRPVWTKPVPKLALIGLLLVPVFGFAALFLAGGGRFKQAQKNLPQTTTAETASQPETVPEELSRLREENGKLKANAAIGDQNILQNRSSKNKPEQKLPRIPANSTAKATDSSKPVTVASAPPQIVSQTSPPRLVSAPVSLPASSYTPVARSMAAKEQMTPTKAENQPDNSMEQWQQLAQLGSYGSSRSERSSDSEWSNASSFHRNPIEERSQLAQANESENPLQSIPTARIAPTSAVQADVETVGDIDQVSETPTQDSTAQSEQSTQVDQTTPERTSAQTETTQPVVQNPTSQPSILKNAEAAILQDQIRQRSLIAGESTPGVLATPITLSDSRGTKATKKANPDQFTIVLTQPLQDSTGQVAIPGGAHLLVQVDEFSRTGQVQLSATTAVWTENSLQKELTLPVGAIQVRGENGKLLVAKQLEDRGKEIASMDAGQFLLGAVRRSAQLFTRSNSQIQTGDGTTVITESNPRPNVLAGVLEGGSNAVLGSIEERNKQAIKEMEQRPNSLFIASGSPVQVFVNQSMLLPN